MVMYNNSMNLDEIGDKNGQNMFYLQCTFECPNFKAQVVFHCIPHYYNYTIFD